MTLFEHVIFGLVVGDLGRYRGLLVVLGVVVGVLVVGVLILWIAAGPGYDGWVFPAGAPDAKQVITAGVRLSPQPPRSAPARPSPPPAFAGTRRHRCHTVRLRGRPHHRP